MKLCVLPGDGIGPEVIGAAVRVLRVVAPELELTEAEAGWETFQATGAALPDATVKAIRAADAVLFGAVASPSEPVPGYRSPIVAMRRMLDLYANIRPVRSIGPGEVDLVLVRENTEGLYASRERLEDDGHTAIAERVITRRGSERIVRMAFELARQRYTRARTARVTLVHKANVLRVTDGLFREVALTVAQDYPEITMDELLVDTAAMHMARTPERFEVLVTTNMFGDILSDIAAIHGGGLGLASSANLGDAHALFEPVHGAAPDLVGTGRANPLATLGCLVLLLEWAGTRLPDSAARVQRLRAALTHVLREGPRTPDLGGQASTDDVTNAVLAYLAQAA